MVIAAARLRDAHRSDPALMVGRAKYPGKNELRAIGAHEAGTNGRAAAKKHKKETYGRKVGDWPGTKPGSAMADPTSR